MYGEKKRRLVGTHPPTPGSKSTCSPIAPPALGDRGGIFWSRKPASGAAEVAPKSQHGWALAPVDRRQPRHHKRRETLVISSAEVASVHTCQRTPARLRRCGRRSTAVSSGFMRPCRSEGRQADRPLTSQTPSRQQRRGNQAPYGLADARDEKSPGETRRHMIATAAIAATVTAATWPIIMPMAMRITAQIQKIALSFDI